MACALTSGRSIPCNEFVGGLYRLYLGDYGDITPGYNAEGFLTGFTATDKLYQYDLKGTSTFVQDMAVTDGSTVVTQTLTIDLKGGDQALNNELKMVAYGRPHAVIVDNFGQAFYVGKTHGLTMTTGNHTTGAAMAEKYGYTITLTGMEREFAPQVLGSTIEDPFIGLTDNTYTEVDNVVTFA